MNKLIYLDNAATTYPKPKNVIASLGVCCEECGNPGRGSHALSLNAAKRIYDCREAICCLFNFSKPENVVFTHNTTHALNLAINGLCPSSGEIIISNLEHNSVLRPVNALCEKSDGKLTFKTFNAVGTDDETVSSFTNSLTQKTVLAVVTACSNVTGRLIPIERIGTVCRSKGIKLIIDAAQSAGIVKLDLSRQFFSAVCFAGHKSLYGVMGSGFCIISPHEDPTPLIYGGNGVHSLSIAQTGSLPEKLEVGTPGVIAINSVREGIKHILCIGEEEIYKKTENLSNALVNRIGNISGINIIDNCKSKVGTVLFTLDGADSEYVCSRLAEKGFCVRGGFHCSPLAHKSLGTLKTGGIRVSFSHFNTEKDVEELATAIQALRL